ncbi:SiaC family regulatory phosphoprotein [Flammeovirga sp. SubArs3]|uniref:SiaC family regulatory phosphoprotein n=1 Tax=Flammeovirga sp. SubArs3 TaxID=2995316 RepID=UPI00248AC3DF|nr:SiaC family regulatory phosphoprotein [Flammeovirga sp. SubArs3]
MNDLIINKENKNAQIPQICLQSAQRKGSIIGESYHPNAHQLYNDIVMWIDDYFKTNQHFSLSFCVSYFDTASNKGIYNILKCLKDWQSKGKTISIVWYVSESDDDLIEDIDDLAEDASVHISTILSDKPHSIAS